MQENKDLVRRLVEASARGGSAGEDVFDRDFRDHSIPVGLESSAEGYKAWMGKLRAALPDLRYLVGDVIAEGDLVCVRGQVEGTHRGEFNGLPASGKIVNVPTIDLFRVRNGKVLEHWGGPDLGVLMQQIGVMPMPEPA